MAKLNLLSTQNRVEVPFIKVTIGDYTFGVYSKSTKVNPGGLYKTHNITYPNYVQSLTVKKINGQVNQYTLRIDYPITPTDDPNFFEKVFSSVSQTRKIVFSYGDLEVPTFMYKDEEALITKVSQQFSMNTSKISYTVYAVSSGILASVGAFTFHGGYMKPSDRIKEILYNKTYGLTDVFTGMRNKNLVERNGLISGDDRRVYVDTKVNISVLDYLTYLISCMQPVNNEQELGSEKKKKTKASETVRGATLYTMVIIDDTSDVYHGPYFKIVKADSNEEFMSTTYEIDIGYPSQNVVVDFQIENDEQYSIFYNYADEITTTEYVQRINNKGELEDVYAPIVSSGNDQFKTSTSKSNWWKNVTEFPVKASITLKGLLRPAILMTHVRLNVIYYGRKHISSGLYIITSQTDTIDGSGYKTQLSLVRVGGDQ